MIASTARPARETHLVRGTSILGIELGSYSIKMCQLESGRLGTQVRLARVIPYSSPLDGKDWQESVEEIDRTLRRAWSKRQSWSPQPAACAVSMNLLEFRTLELSDSDGGLDPDALTTAFLEGVPLESGPWMIAGWPMGGNQTGQGKSHYAALGAEEGFADALSSMLWSHRLDCQSLDGVPFALGRAAWLTTRGSESIAVLDWGYSGATVVVVDESGPGYTRRLRDCGLSLLSESVQKAFQIDEVECRHLLAMSTADSEAFGSADSDLQEMLGEVVAPYLRRMHDELQRTWQFLRQQLGEQAPRRLLVTGGGATLPGCRNLLQPRESFSVEFWVPPTGWQISERSGAAPELFAVSAGLALLPRVR